MDVITCLTVFGEWLKAGLKLRRRSRPPTRILPCTGSARADIVSPCARWDADKAAVRFQVVREVFSPDLSAGHQVIGLARIQRLSDGRFQSSSLGWARGARSFRKGAIASGS